MNARVAEPSRPWVRILWAIFVAALAIRIGALIATGRLADPLTWEYEVMASNLLAGRGLVYSYLGIEYTSFTGPIFPLWCALIYTVSDHNRTVAILLLAVLSAVVAVLAAAWGRRLFQHQAAGWTAGALVAVHPGLVFYSTMLHAATLDALLFTLVGWAVWRLRERPTWPHRLVTGLVLGVSLLERPILLVFLPCFAVWYLRVGTRGMSHALRTILAVVMIAAAVMGPWGVRNYLIHHRVVLMQSTSGLSFWKGNHPGATGGNFDQAGRPVLSSAPETLTARLRTATNEFEQDRIFWEEALQFVTDHPGDFLELWMRKWARFWLFVPAPHTPHPGWALALYRGWSVAIWLLALLGIWYGRRRGPIHDGLWLITLFCVSVGFGQCLSYVEGRHRLFVDPLLLLATSYGLVKSWQTVRARIARERVPVGIAHDSRVAP